MIVKKAHILELDTPIGKRYRVLLEGYEKHNSVMKNGKKVQAFCIYSGGELNPFGFGTLEEIRAFYDKKRYLTEGIPEPKNFNFSISCYNPSLPLNELKPLPFPKICDMVTMRLNKPTTLTKLFGKEPKITINFKEFGFTNKLSKVSIEDIDKEWLKVRIRRHEISSIVFHGYHESKQQRREMESKYYLIRIISETDINYAMGSRGGMHLTTSKKENAKQFRSENEVLDYALSYQYDFGKTGYTIEEVPGMKLEDGLEV